MESVSTKPYQYRIVECLGEGLNSCVYRAFKESTELKIRFEVALKILKSKNLEALWRNEFERLTRVKSRNCVVLHGWELINNAPALILEYVKGVNLAELIRYSTLSRQDVDMIYTQARQGLTDLAAAGLFHGDLNLNNIMVDEAGAVKLVDFGIRNGKYDIFITPKYAAPKVLMGEEPTLDTDLFSLEAICSELETRIVEHFNDGANDPIEELGKKVRGARQRRDADRVRTNVRQLTRRFYIFRRSSRYAWAERLAVCLVGVLISILSRGDIRAGASVSPAHLIIRTAKWLEIRVNDHDYGYSPVVINLPGAQSAELQWRGPNGTGNKSILLSPGQTEILTDSFFSQNQK